MLLYYKVSMSAPGFGGKPLGEALPNVDLAQVANLPSQIIEPPKNGEAFARLLGLEDQLQRLGNTGATVETATPEQWAGIRGFSLVQMAGRGLYVVGRRIRTNTGNGMSALELVFRPSHSGRAPSRLMTGRILFPTTQIENNLWVVGTSAIIREHTANL